MKKMEEILGVKALNGEKISYASLAVDARP